MKNKLSVLLVSLLLCLTLFPRQAMAASASVSERLSAVSETIDSEKKEYPNEPEISEMPAPQSYILVQSEDPGWSMEVH